jgi:hypothetical protein
MQFFILIEKQHPNFSKIIIMRIFYIYNYIYIYFLGLDETSPRQLAVSVGLGCRSPWYKSRDYNETKTKTKTKTKEKETTALKCSFLSLSFSFSLRSVSRFSRISTSQKSPGISHSFLYRERKPEEKAIYRRNRPWAGLSYWV